MENTNGNSENFTLNTLDEVSVLRLELMDQLIACKKEVENSLREGYFQLGKSRYIMGTHSVSMVQVPSATCDIESQYCTSALKRPIEEIPALLSHEFDISTVQNLMEDPPKEDLIVRKRGTQAQDIKQRNEEISDDDKAKKVDPLHWFTALPPQSLRKAQQHFRQALFQIAQCATLQSKLNVLNSNLASNTTNIVT